MEKVDVAVIGAGATGAGVARDLALRGLSVALVDKADVADGTSGRNHGLLHSGGRYAVKDAHAAQECIRENLVLKQIAAHTIDECGGIFVSLEEDDPEYARAFAKCCKEAGIEAERIGPTEALEREPRLNPTVREAFVVPDAAVDPFFLCLANVVDAFEHGATILTHHALTGVATDGNKVTTITLTNQLDGSERQLQCRCVVNAAGPWAGKVGAVAGLDVGLMLSQGTLIVTQARLVRGVVNRCRPPSDGDIIVPGGPVCLLGTTSVTVESPDNPLPVEGEADRMVAEGVALVPGFQDARIIREFAGVRPLFKDKNAGGDGRNVSRGFAVLDHEQRDGLGGFVTVVGGKLTTYRLMAEQVADMVCSKLGHDGKCTTAQELLPGSEPAPQDWDWPKQMPGWEARAIELRHGSRATRVVAEEQQRDEKLSGLSRTCLCESVSEAEVRYAIRNLFARTLDDVRRRTRVGMGPCQGSTCGPRTIALLADELDLSPRQADRMLYEFIMERRRGTNSLTKRKGAAQEEFNMSAARGFVRTEEAGS